MAWTDKEEKEEEKKTQTNNNKKTNQQLWNQCNIFSRFKFNLIKCYHAMYKSYKIT